MVVRIYTKIFPNVQPWTRSSEEEEEEEEEEEACMRVCKCKFVYTRKKSTCVFVYTICVYCICSA